MKQRIRFFAMLLSVVVLTIGVTYAIAAPAQQAQNVTITVSDFQFTAKDITIPVGSSVVWTNSGQKKHTATADDGSFDTGVIAPGASSAPVKFDKPGTFAYFCQFHGAPGGVDMAGTITVTAGGQVATAAAATAAPPAAGGKAIGHISFSNKAKGANADELTVAITSIPIPAEGQQYEVWVADGKNPPLSLGALTVKADGTGSIVYDDPKGANLIGQFNVALITTQGTDLTKPGPVAFSGLVPPQADVHVRHVMAKFPETPDNIGLLIGALDQESILTQHVGFLNDAVTKGNVVLAKLHLEHIHNILTGTNGAKDLDGNGKLAVIPPSDGFGLFNYLTTTVQHADLASKQPDATDVIKVKANHIKIAAANASTILTQIQTLAIQAAGKTTIADIKPLAAQIAQLNALVVKGKPDASGAVTPTKGSAGLGLAYAEGEAMAGFDLLPGDVTAQVAPAPTSAAPAATAVPPTTAPTAVPPTAAPAAGATTITIVMKDFEFADKNVTIKAGTSIIFSNQGTKKHTATADDNSFDTGVVAPGTSSAPIKFDKPGTIPFYCQFHGGPGGVDMSGVITVQ